MNPSIKFLIYFIITSIYIPIGLSILIQMNNSLGIFICFGIMFILFYLSISSLRKIGVD